MNPRHATGRIASLFVSLALSACFPLDGPEHRLDEQYYLWAADISEQMALYRQLPENGGIERVGQTVFAAGADRRHVIAQRHPQGDRTRTEYFILERAKDAPLADSKTSVRGPFTKEEFEQARVRLGVAPTLSFSVVLERL
ncbi:MAG TPA: hypothetical protein VFR15_06710 [Chloroflexia bacterium]|nr:hypothetical protein [Chloroflexia bacterium]